MNVGHDRRFGACPALFAAGSAIPTENRRFQSCLTGKPQAAG
jgi:hypothetical protein